MSVKKLLDLSGKVALITGGSRGLGLQLAEALGEMGAKLALTARKSDELDEAKDHLGQQGVEALPLVCDLSKHDTIAAMVERVLAHYGHIDILINNAGATWGAPAEDHPLDAWEKLINLNLTGTFVVTQAVGKRSMIPRRYGRIINMASIAGIRGNPVDLLETLAYNTTKGGLVNFTRALAAEWGEHGISVNAIAPGFFPSKMTRAALEHIGKRIIERTPLRRLGDDEDLKGLACLLASDASRHITGQVIAVDGGATTVKASRAPDRGSTSRPRTGKFAATHQTARGTYKPMSKPEFGVTIPFVEQLGIRLVERSKERAIVSLAKRADLLNSWGATHGGVIMTMLDLVMSMAVRGHYDVAGGVLTVDMSVGFLNASFGDISAEGRVLNAGKSTAFCEAEARDETGKLLSKAIGTFKLLPEKKPA